MKSHSFAQWRNSSCPLLLKTLTAVMVVSLNCAGLNAGGPLAVVAPGVFARWNPNQPVVIRIDQGALRSAPFISNQEGVDFVLSTVAEWDIDSATITIEEGPQLGMDVDSSNYMPFLSQPLPQGNPVIFDRDGSITDDYFGAGSSNTVLGFATAVRSDPDPFFDWGFVVLNGRQATLSPTGTFRRVIVHELGHLLGLDHSQGNRDIFAKRQYQFVPLMFPYVVPTGPVGPRYDDRVWLSYLYPKVGFFEARGTIRGNVLRRTGGALFGANVVAVPVQSDGETWIEQPQELVSVVSDFLVQSNGFYELPGLEPGSYVVFIEPLASNFTGGSGVGPYDVRFDRFPKDYYNGENESGDALTDDPFEKSVLPVSASEVIDGITLFANEGSNDLSSLSDDDQELYVFPQGFTFPFFGTVYDRVSVNSDGNLTFGSGDSASSPRSESRFLQGPPRIAPLFTDLDPGKAGEVQASFDGASMLFKWVDVPEFTDFGVAPGNTFSVRLFPDGSFIFEYEDVALTPDPGGDLDAIVGAAPGGSATPGDQIDWSAAESPVILAGEPLYQVFLGQSFDLEHVLVQGSGLPDRLYFPVALMTDSLFTGVSLANDSDQSAVFLAQALDSDGEKLDLTRNPVLDAVGPHGQFARLARDLFESPLVTNQRGWLEIDSSQEFLSGFFEIGDGVAGVPNQLDGGVALKEPGTRFVFSRVHQGEGSFQAGDKHFSAATFFYLANPQTVPISGSVKLIRLDGTLVVESPFNLAGHGFLETQSDAIFGFPTIVDCYAVVEFAEPGGLAFSLIQVGDSLLGNPANDEPVTTAIYSAQLASGDGGGVVLSTSTRVINLSADVRSVEFEAIGEDGSSAGKIGPLQISPGSGYDLDAADLFAPVEGAGSQVGSLVVTADEAGIVGDVVFGEEGSFRFGAKLLLQDRLFTRAFFGHVANTLSEDPVARVFTGLALFNPNPEAAAVTVNIFGSGGIPTGSGNLVLGGGERLSKVVWEIVPESQGQVGGYMIVESDRELIGQELFGNNTLDYLSAVPPTSLSNEATPAALGQSSIRPFLHPFLKRIDQGRARRSATR